MAQVELQKLERPYYRLPVTYHKAFERVDNGVEWAVGINGQAAASGFALNKREAEREAADYIYRLIRDETMGPGPYIKEE